MQGFLFVARFLNEMKSSTFVVNDVHQYFLGVLDGEQLLAIGGVTPAPYLDNTDIGRIRNLYVAGIARRCGIGRQLMQELERRATKTYSALRLRTDAVAAATFYESIGYTRTSEANATHGRDLNTR